MLNFGQKIKKLRTDAGMSQAMLAEHIGVSVQSISNWECNNTMPDISQIVPLASILCVSTDYLLGVGFDEKADHETLIRNINTVWANYSVNTKESNADLLVADLYKEYLRKYHLTRQITGTPTFMMKKAVLEEVGGFEIVPMGQEYYLMQKILQTDCTIGYYPRCHIKAYRTAAEAISTGKNKIFGEKKLYKYKKTFFNILSFSEKQYVRCRHYAVMAIAYKRNKMYFKAIANLIVSVLCSPFVAIKEAFGLKKRKREVNKNENSI